MNRLARLLSANLALIVALACTGGGSDDSNSHWLGICESTASCAAGLECLCGICAARCADDDACAAVSADATCRPSTRCGGAPDTCVAPCNSTADCARHGDHLACLGGICGTARSEAPDAGPGAGGAGGVPADSGPADSGGSASGGGASGGAGGIGSIRCGNDSCDPGESRWDCAYDCGYCGDRVCGSGETTRSCPNDCDPLTAVPDGSVTVDAGAPDADAPDARPECDAAPAPAPDGSDACTACIFETCPCEIARGGDPAVAVCLWECREVPQTMQPYCRAGYFPGSRPTIGNPQGFPPMRFCGGPSSATSPENQALVTCAANCPPCG
ncbi:MAG: hypothetical protein FJ104_01505 [Deltaproteobacteria bacterium]|nr:hypothetical protein [Deltaproteobacteria bacterium]